MKKNSTDSMIMKRDADILLFIELDDLFQDFIEEKRSWHIEPI